MSDPDTNPDASDAAERAVPRAEDTGARQIANADDGAVADGGLGGASAARSIAGSARAPGGASPNSPIDVGVSPDGEAKEAREAQLRSLADDPGASGSPSR